MSISENAAPPEVQFDGLAEALERIDAHAGAAQTHGLISGVVCAGADSAAWMSDIIDVEGAAAREGTRLLLGVYEETERRLACGAFEFYPLLPDDDEPLDVRSAALGAWCGGFLSGLGWAKLPHFDALPEASREILGDLAKLAAIREAEDDDEAEEAAYMQLVEYVRVGVMLLREELVEVGPHGQTLH